jgi:hypothetical protein
MPSLASRTFETPAHPGTADTLLLRYESSHWLFSSGTT